MSNSLKYLWLIHEDSTQQMNLYRLKVIRNCAPFIKLSWRPRLIFYNLLRDERSRPNEPPAWRPLGGHASPDLSSAASLGANTPAPLHTSGFRRRHLAPNNDPSVRSRTISRHFSTLVCLCFLFYSTLKCQGTKQIDL